MLKVGEKLWNGTTVTEGLATTYNRLQERIQTFKDAGLPVPEYLLNASHNLLNSN